MGGGEGDEDLGDDAAGADSPQPGVTETPPETPRLTRPPDESRRPDPVADAEEAAGTLVISMPEMGESVTEGTVLEWHVGEGDSVSEGDTVVEVSTDKIDAEVPAPASGTVTKLLVEPDATVQVGQALAEMTSGAAPAGDGAAPADAATTAAEEPAPADAGNGRASPVARRWPRRRASTSPPSRARAPAAR